MLALCGSSILLLLGGAVLTAQPSGQEAPERLSLSALERLSEAGLNAEAASEIRSDLANKSYADAETKLLARLEGKPNPRALLEVLGGVFFLDSKYLEAAIAYKKAEKYGPLTDDSRFTLALTYIELKRTEWARDELLHLASEKPRQVLYRYWLGRLDYDKQNFGDCIAAFSKAIELEDQFFRAYEGRGLCEEATGDAAAAEADYQVANALNRRQESRSAWPALEYGALLGKLGRDAEAMLLLHEALKINPSFQKAYYELGRVEERNSQTEAAIADYRAAERLDPNDPSAIYALFRLYKKTGRSELAAAMIARFRALKVNSSERP